jgi:exosortase H (IPTLxxWG-CTERM-specific)
MFRRFVPHPSLVFVGLFIGLTLLSSAVLMIPAVDKGFTQPFTHMLVVVCAGVMRLFGAPVAAHGDVLSFNGGAGAILVSSGCNGVEVCVLFAAATLAFPAPMPARLIGAAVGVLAIQAINLLRIISLVILARFAQGVFDFFHLYVWDAFIMLDGILLFMVWNAWQSRRWPAVGA